jgi:hypothetical protein
VTSVASRGGLDAERDDDEASDATQAPDEVVVLHDRQRSIAAQSVERRSRDEDRLVAVDGTA